MGNIFEIKDIKKEYTSFCLKDVNISCPEGAIMGLIGPNGAGKSTLISILTGTIRANSGTVTVFGKDIEELTNDEKEDIGVVFDSNCLPEGLCAKEIDGVFQLIYKKWDSKKYYDLIDKLQIPDNKKIKEMSSGNKIKINLAVALSHDPRLLVLDEITGALDPVTRDEIMEMFLDFIQREDRSILFSSHITTDLEKVADYITFIKDGVIVFSKEKDSLLYDNAIIRCKSSCYSKINKAGIIAQRDNSGVFEILWDKTISEIDEMQGVVVEKPTVDEIMLIITKGESDERTDS